MTPDQPPAHPVAEPEQAPIPMCGLVMPISGTPDHPRYTADHWLEVRYVIDAAVKAAGFHPRLVSEGDSSGLIHGRIVQNLGDCPMVVCDVSSRNPNVMFELGLRLAFNKPTIVVKDEITEYAFDTGVIDHLAYPVGLRIRETHEFQQRLTAMIDATYAQAQSDPNYSTFLSHFTLPRAKLDTREVSKQDLVVENINEQLKILTASVKVLARHLELTAETRPSSRSSGPKGTNTVPGPTGSTLLTMSPEEAGLHVALSASDTNKLGALSDSSVAGTSTLRNSLADLVGSSAAGTGMLRNSLADLAFKNPALTVSSTDVNRLVGSPPGASKVPPKKD